jgi:hypothetical protein
MVNAYSHFIIDEFTHEPFHALNPIAGYLVLLTAVIHILAQLSQDWTSILLKGLRAHYALTHQLYHSIFDGVALRHLETIRSDIPVDIRQVLQALQLRQPPSTTYACCPNNRCSKIYKPSSRNTWPERCTNAISPGNVCGSSLLKREPNTNPAPTQQPIRPFVLFDVKYQIAELACLEPNTTHLKRKPGLGRTNEEQITDIFQGSLVRDFEGPLRGPNGTKHFFDVEENETRLLFTISVDWMNPFGVKAAGISASVGVIALCCVNLPIEVQYKPENLILAGIVPGPSEPPLDTINYFLKPLVDDFLLLWERSIQPSSLPSGATSIPPNYRIRAALLALVTDMPASKKIAGNLSHKANKFCSLCLLDREEMSNLKVESWPKRSCQQHRTDAFAWLNGSRAARKELQKESGVRFSELFRLHTGIQRGKL